MSDIAEIQLKIKAVEFALRSFSKFRNKEEERVAFLDSQLETVQYLDVYLDFALNNLQDALSNLYETENKLLEKENLLLAQQRDVRAVTQGNEAANQATGAGAGAGTSAGKPIATSVHTASFRKPNVSASVIASHYQSSYDVFAHVGGAGTYVPNVRIREVLDSPVDHRIMATVTSLVERSFSCSDNFRGIEIGSETALVDKNLQSLMSIMADLSGGVLKCSKTNSEKDAMYLAKAASPEHSLQIREGLHKGMVVAGSEAKGTEASLQMCYPQLIAVCGSACVEMNRLGLPRDECAVLGVAMAGSSCQFCGVYLLDANFPVLTALSPELALFGTYDEQNLIAEWCLRCVKFGKDTATRLMTRCGSPQKRVTVELDMSGYFPKPVRNFYKVTEAYADLGVPRQLSSKYIRLNHILRLYEQLRRVPDVQRVILFPEGVISIPGDDVPETLAIRTILLQDCRHYGFRNLDFTFSPVILFPRLDGWRIDKPPIHLRERYMILLQEANDAMNQARIAHLDERPANIMWKESGNSEQPDIDLRLIDFEDAVLFDHIIPPEFVLAVLNTADSRYPFTSGDEDNAVFARAAHNQFFVEALRLWINSDVDDFHEFMDVAGAEIRANIL